MYEPVLGLLHTLVAPNLYVWTAERGQITHSEQGVPSPPKLGILGGERSRKPASHESPSVGWRGEGVGAPKIRGLRGEAKSVEFPPTPPLCNALRNL